jgi:hypothetical protein
MHWSTEQLEEITRLAAAAYQPSEIAYMLGIKPSLLKKEINDEDSAVAIAFFKGFYSSELAVRESILLLARNGSSPAQASSLQLFKNARQGLIATGCSPTSEGEE